jgi:hypothetical protein
MKNLNLFCSYENLLPNNSTHANLERTIERALQEASEDAILKKLRRISYSANAASEVINFMR